MRTIRHLRELLLIVCLPWIIQPGVGTSAQIICESEEFTTTSSAWHRIVWGENYFAAPYSNAFLSGDAALSAPADCDDAEAYMEINIPQSGRYLVLARYEAAYRFETHFQIVIDQQGTNIFMRHYGTRDSQKLWAFGRGLTEEARWPWGAVENIVWEGHNATVELRAGSACLRLLAGRQQHPPARRNIDAIILLADTNALADWIRGHGSPDDILVSSGRLRMGRLSDAPASSLARKADTNWPGSAILPTLEMTTASCQPATGRIDNLKFQSWLASRGVKPSAIDPAYGLSWELVFASSDETTAARNPWLYYYSKLFVLEQTVATGSGAQMISATNRPRALFLAPSTEPYCLGSVSAWIAPFRTSRTAIAPFGADEFWRQPVGSPQMTTIRLDMFRNALAGRSDPQIIWSPLPTIPPNTPRAWRRQFYAALAHGMRIAALELPDAQITNTTVDVTAMRTAMEKARREYTGFSDIFGSCRILPAGAAMLWSETGDIWQDLKEPFAAGKRTLFAAIRHRQVPLDVITEEDIEHGDLRERQLLFVADRHIRDSTAIAIAGWVASGGVAVAICGGIRNEFDQANEAAEDLLGIRLKKIETPLANTIAFEKQDLPFAKPLDSVSIGTNSSATILPIYAASARVLARGAEVLGSFSDGSPAITRRRNGRGAAIWLGFLPGLSYFKPALPLRPVDQSMAEDSLAHFLPTNFDKTVAALLEEFTANVSSPVRCDNPLVEGALLAGTNGAIVPLINWSGTGIPNLRVRLAVTGDVTVTMVSGSDVRISTDDAGLSAILPIEDADALILRPKTQPSAKVPVPK